MNLEAEDEGGVGRPGRVRDEPVERDEEQVGERGPEERAIQGCSPKQKKGVLHEFSAGMIKYYMHCQATSKAYSGVPTLKSSLLLTVALMFRRGVVLT